MEKSESEKKAAEKKRLMILGGVGAVLLIAMIGNFARTATPKITDGAGPLWYYDLNANKLVRGKDQLPPVVVDGKTLYRAFVFACGDCAQADKRFIAYLEKYEAEAKKDLEKARVNSYMGPNGLEKLNPDHLRSLPADSVQVRVLNHQDWIDEFSELGQKIVESPQDRCGSVAAISCDGAEFTP